MASDAARKALPSQLSEIAYRRIKAALITCEILPGSTVTEPALVETYALGKAAVRTALTRLAQEGLIEAVRRQGYRISEVTASDVREIFQLRSLIEPEIIRLAAGRLSDSQIARLKAACNKPEQKNSSDNKLSDFLRSNREFHLIIAEAAGNDRLSDLLEKLLDEIERMLFLGLLSHDDSEKFRMEHLELLRALVANEADRAAAMVRNQVQGGYEMVVRAMLENVQLDRAVTK